MISENNDTNSEIAALKSQIFSLLIALIVISGTLTVYLLCQTSWVGKDLVQERQIRAVLDQRDVAITTFANELQAYGEKHPDFRASVLAKYGIPAAPAK